MSQFNPKKNLLFAQQFFSLLRESLFISALPLTVFALAPLAANAATLSTASNRSVLVLLTGFGEDPSNSGTGLNQLNTKLQNQFGGNLNQLFDSKIFTYSQQSEAFNYIQGFNDIGSLGIIGYSLGGNAANQLAGDVETRPVNLLVQIDSVGISDQEVPGNVSKAFNYYQSNTRCPGCSFTERIAEVGITQLVQKEVEGAEDINVERLFNDSSITHLNIDNNVRLHELIANNVGAFLFPNLPPVSATPVSFAATATPATVPEPSSVLGILAVSTVGAAAMLKRKQQQKA